MADANRMIEEIKNLVETLPTRVPSTLRCGWFVRDALVAVASRPSSPWFPQGLRALDVRIVVDDSYQPDEWRLFDQWDDELHAGTVAARGEEDTHA